jgi:hypothetical protein
VVGRKPKKKERKMLVNVSREDERHVEDEEDDDDDDLPRRDGRRESRAKAVTQRHFILPLRSTSVYLRWARIPRHCRRIIT